MKKFIAITILPITFSLCASVSSPDWVYLDFDTSMQTALYPQAIDITKRVVGLDGAQLLGFFKNLYNKNNPCQIAPNSSPKIPLIIHQIWLGGNMPDVYKPLIKTWFTFHEGKGWRYKLWTENDIKKLNLYNQDLYDATDNYGMKSDIARYEILYRFGGVYIDTDFECLHALDQLNYLYDFYTGIQPLDSGYLQLGIGLIGAAPGHPILKHAITSMKDDAKKQGIPARTGPIHLTLSFVAKAGKEGTTDIAFPAHYFYPLTVKQKDLDYDTWIAQGAYGVHHWAKSWMPSKYRPKQFRNLNNDASVENWNPS